MLSKQPFFFIWFATFYLRKTLCDVLMSTKLLLRGTLDDENPLSKLRGNDLVLQKIFSSVDSWYSENMQYSCDAFKIITPKSSNLIEFPMPTGINITMMPINVLDNYTIPDFCKQYTSIIDICKSYIPLIYIRNNQVVSRLKDQTIAYLTIQETYDPIFHQGIHIDFPRLVKGGEVYKRDDQLDDILVDGSFVVANVPGLYKVWPSLLNDPQHFVDSHQGLEHARDRLDNGYCLNSNELCWLTERTPYEFLPVNETKYQYLKLVVGKLSAWHSNLYTKNPCGLQPDVPVL